MKQLSGDFRVAVDELRGVGGQMGEQDVVCYLHRHGPSFENGRNWQSMPACVQRCHSYARIFTSGACVPNQAFRIMHASQAFW